LQVYRLVKPVPRIVGSLEKRWTRILCEFSEKKGRQIVVAKAARS